MEQPIEQTADQPAQEQLKAPAQPAGMEISSAAIMMEAQAQHDMSWMRRLMLAQETLVLKAEVAGRDVRIEQLQQDIGDRDTHSVAVDRDLDTKIARIAELEAHLIDRETQIGGLLRDLTAKDEAIRLLQSELGKAHPAIETKGDS